MDILLFGIQGSGKGTQAKMLAEDFDLRIFETGAALRRISQSPTELGRTVKSYIDAGNLAPTPVVMQAVQQAIALYTEDQRILFDGIPRSIEQMREFNGIMQGLRRSFRGIQLIVDEEEAVQRIVKRARSEGRADDQNEESVRQRMHIFREQTVPVIEAYRASGNMIDIDGEGEVDEVYIRLKEAVSDML
jgi:adenylate kinase